MSNHPQLDGSDKLESFIFKLLGLCPKSLFSGTANKMAPNRRITLFALDEQRQVEFSVKCKNSETGLPTVCHIDIYKTRCQS